MTQAVIRLNQVWELDSTPADVMCADGRHVIVGAMDAWSRRGRLLVVPVSRATAICALLRRCLIDWGVPETGRCAAGAPLRRTVDAADSHDALRPALDRPQTFDAMDTDPLAARLARAAAGGGGVLPRQRHAYWL